MDLSRPVGYGESRREYIVDRPLSTASAAARTVGWCWFNSVSLSRHLTSHSQLSCLAIVGYLLF